MERENCRRRSEEVGSRSSDIYVFLFTSSARPRFYPLAGRTEPHSSQGLRQEVNMVGQGRYPVGIGFSDSLAEERTKQGVPLAIVDPRQLKEGSDVSPASGGLSIFNRAPHLNASKVYINWLISKEGQTLYARATGYLSARLDVSTDHAAPWRVPQSGSVKTYTQEAMDVKKQLTPLLTEVFGR